MYNICELYVYKIHVRYIYKYILTDINISLLLYYNLILIGKELNRYFQSTFLLLYASCPSFGNRKLDIFYNIFIYFMYYLLYL